MAVVKKVVIDPDVTGDLNVSNDLDVGGTLTASNLSVSGSITQSFATTDNALARYDGVNGKLQNSNVLIDDNGDLEFTHTPAKINLAGALQIFNGTPSSTMDFVSDNFRIFNQAGSQYKLLLLDDKLTLDIDANGNDDLVISKDGSGNTRIEGPKPNSDIILYLTEDKVKFNNPGSGLFEAKFPGGNYRWDFGDNGTLNVNWSASGNGFNLSDAGGSGFLVDNNTISLRTGNFTRIEVSQNATKLNFNHELQDGSGNKMIKLNDAGTLDLAGTGGINFDPDSDGIDEASIDSAGNISTDGSITAGGSLHVGGDTDLEIGTSAGNLFVQSNGLIRISPDTDLNQELIIRENASQANSIELFNAVGDVVLNSNNDKVRLIADNDINIDPHQSGTPKFNFTVFQNNGDFEVNDALGNLAGTLRGQTNLLHLIAAGDNLRLVANSEIQLDPDSDGNAEVSIDSEGTIDQSVSGGRVVNVTSVSNDYTVVTSDYLISVDTSANSPLLTLPNASATSGRAYKVKDNTGNAAANNITVSGINSETFDGSSTDVISTNYGSREYVSDGTNWMII